MPPRDPTVSFALLGLLALRTWTGYELTQQVRRSLEFVAPSSEAQLYREQQALVRAGFATMTVEPAGRRTRKRYAITPAGRRALREWLSTDPSPPAFDIEAITRVWLADQGTPADLVNALNVTATESRRIIDGMLPLLESYLRPDPAFPERAAINAIAAEMLTDLLGALEARCTSVAAEVARWDGTTGRELDAATRRRIRRVLDSHDRDAPNGAG